MAGEVDRRLAGRVAAADDEDRIVGAHLRLDQRRGPVDAEAGRDLVEHSALIYGIAADGKVTTLYPANFDPSQIVHDVPLLEQ